MCNICRFTDCESCTRPISTNPGSMEAGEYGLTRGTCSWHAISRWSRSPGCCGFRGVFWMRRGFFVFFFFFFFFERTLPAVSMRSPCLIYLSTSNEAVFCLLDKEASSYRGACRVPLFNESVCHSVCQSMCNIRRFY